MKLEPDSGTRRQPEGEARIADVKGARVTIAAPAVLEALKRVEKSVKVLARRVLHIIHQ
jgi:hypothetical protein